MTKRKICWDDDFPDVQVKPCECPGKPTVKSSTCSTLSKEQSPEMVEALKKIREAVMVQAPKGNGPPPKKKYTTDLGKLRMRDLNSGQQDS